VVYLQSAARLEAGGCGGCRPLRTSIAAFRILFLMAQFTTQFRIIEKYNYDFEVPKLEISSRENWRMATLNALWFHDMALNSKLLCVRYKYFDKIC
jgi:hypothetical protein